MRVERPYIKDRLYVIDFTGGWSFGEPQSFVSSCFSTSRSQVAVVERVFSPAPINFPLAVLQYFHGIARGPSVHESLSHRKPPDDVAEFVEQKGNASLSGVSIVKTYLQPVPSRTYDSG